MQNNIWAHWPPHPSESAGLYATRPTEAQRVAADLARNAAKNTGRLQAEEVERARVDELPWLRSQGVLA